MEIPASPLAAVPSSLLVAGDDVLAARPLVFAYDFAHKKTQDVILRLVAIGQPPLAVIAAPPVSLRVPAPAVRLKARHSDLMDPAVICRSLDIPYLVLPHDSDDCLFEIDALSPQVAIISGARILSRAVIERVPRGIVNLHPGLLPEVRGLDALAWALYRELPLGVTAHLINERVDAGLILATERIDEYPDDTLVDLGLRLYESQMTILPNALARASRADTQNCIRVIDGAYNRSFPAELVPEMLRRFRARRERLAIVPDAVAVPRS